MWSRQSPSAPASPTLDMFDLSTDTSAGSLGWSSSCPTLPKPPVLQSEISSTSFCKRCLSLFILVRISLFSLAIESHTSRSSSLEKSQRSFIPSKNFSNAAGTYRDSTKYSLACVRASQKELPSSYWSELWPAKMVEPSIHLSGAEESSRELRNFDLIRHQNGSLLFARNHQCAENQ